ncbi:MAG: glycosyltransferase [Mariprofundus sp.]|nr:glycosyltransferase [Mariprofundus sp.]
MSGVSLAIVISTYNQPDFLRLTLEGYRRQTDTNFTIYIADDGSTPETAQTIRHVQADFPVTIHHLWQADNGFRKARIHNRVISRISETHTLLTDGDCIPLPGLIAAQRRFAGDHYFISGSRVLLSRPCTERMCQLNSFETARSMLWWLRQRISGSINRLFPLLLPATLSQPSFQLEGIRGCHLSCPTKALVRINGFDESFEGWGREDSDLTARLLHAGFSRRNLRGLPVLHLWHQESSRQRLEENDTMLQACLNERRIEARIGLKHLEIAPGDSDV